MNSRGGGRKPSDGLEELDVLAELRAELRRVLDETARLTHQVEVRPDRGIDFSWEVTKYERDLIRTALRIANGKQREAARLLRLSPSTLCLKIKALGINPREL